MRTLLKNWPCILIMVGLLIQAIPAWAQPFTERSNGVLLDQKTGLVWQKGDSYHDLGKGMDWYKALEYVSKKNAEEFAGYRNWRLPTLKELNAIWDSKRPTVSKDGEPIGLSKSFNEGGSYYLWTADERGLDHAWYFGLGAKENYFNLKDLGDLEQGVKLVRNSK